MLYEVITFGRLGMAFGLGFTLAPVMGAWLGAVDLHLPFYVAAVLCGANFCYGYFVLPESLPPRTLTIKGVEPPAPVAPETPEPAERNNFV